MSWDNIYGIAHLKSQRTNADLKSECPVLILA